MESLPKEASDFLKEISHPPLSQVCSLVGDASQRKYYRLFSEDLTSLLMLWESSHRDKNFPFLSIQRHFTKHHIHVPKIISYNSDLTIFVLEDLGDLTLEQQFWNSPSKEQTLSLYEDAIDELIKIHFHSTKDTPSSCTAFQVEFNTEKLRWEMNYGKKHLLEDLMGINFSSGESAEIESVFTQICSQLYEQPKYICHRDYHSRNLLIHNQKVYVIDFQDARLGPIQYDLVSLLHDSYVHLDSESIGRLLEYYHQQSKGAYEPHNFDYIFDLQTIQRCFKACGSFASFYNTRGDSSYLKYIPGTLAKVKDCLTDFPEYAIFAEVLIKNPFSQENLKDL